MADVSVSKFNSAGTESFSTTRKTGWFSLSDLSKNVLVRRLNARYDSSDDVSVNIYADGDSDSPVWTGTMPKNGDTGTTLDGAITDSATTISVVDSASTQSGMLLIDKEFIKIESTNGNALTVLRGQNNTQPNAHSSGAKVYYGHKKWDSLRVGRRAKYMSVQISTGASTNNVEINKLEFVTDG
jgi:hypothetical protein